MMPHAESGHTGGVAIIGMSCLFPGAPDVDAYWRNILGKVDAISDPPAGGLGRRTSTTTPTSPTPTRRTASAAATSARWPRSTRSPTASPRSRSAASPTSGSRSQLADDALADAGALELPAEVRARTAVILGKGTYLNGGNAIAVQRGLIIDQTLDAASGGCTPSTPTRSSSELREEMKRCAPAASARRPCPG